MVTPPPAPARREGGIPDGLLLGIIGFLLGTTALVWTGTGLAGLLAHGHWPHGLHFTRTPLAMRQLLVQPKDLAGAWQHVPAADLPRPGLFWGIFISEMLVLLLLGGFALGTLARWRAVRARGRQDTMQGPTWTPAQTAPDMQPQDRPLTSQPPIRPAQPPGHPPSTSVAGWTGQPAGQQAPQMPLPPPLPHTAQMPHGQPAPGPTAQPHPAVVPPGPPHGWHPVEDPGPGPSAVRHRAGGSGASVPAGHASRSTDDPLAVGPLTGSHVLFAVAGPRSDKGKRIVQPAVLEAEGPVVVTCATPRTWQETVGNRAKLGPVHLFDPEHLIDFPGRLRWAPHTGCADPVTAALRARALLAPLLTLDVTGNEAAVTLLRCWLHAAEVGRLPFRQVHRWATGSGSAEALRILRTSRDAASGWSGELESTLHAHPDRRDMAQALIQHALSGLTTVHIRDACNPSRSSSLNLESFMNERGTLYVVGVPREDPRTQPGAMPLLTALVSSVVEHGRRMAEGSSPGRLDPPLTCVFDDIATLAPLPELPQLMAEGPTLGISVIAVLRSEEQARHRWPPRDAENIWRAATTRLTDHS